MDQRPTAAAPKPRISGLAISSLVFALVGLAFWPFALVALAIGAAAFVQIWFSRGRLAGTWIALLGVLLSGVWLLLSVRTDHPESARQVVCISNLHMLARAMVMYADHNSDRLPPAGKWSDAISTYVRDKDIYVCPEARQLRCGYAFNRDLSSRRVAEVEQAGDIVLLFESNRGWNASGGPEALPAKPRHDGRDLFVFPLCDVHAVARQEVGQIKWDPRSKAPLRRAR